MRASLTPQILGRIKSKQDPGRLVGARILPTKYSVCTAIHQAIRWHHSLGEASCIVKNGSSMKVSLSLDSHSKSSSWQCPLLFPSPYTLLGVEKSTGSLRFCVNCPDARISVWKYKATSYIQLLLIVSSSSAFSLDQGQVSQINTDIHTYSICLKLSLFI